MLQNTAEMQTTPAVPLRMITQTHKDYWRNILEQKAIRKVTKDDPYGVGLAAMLSTYVSLAEKAYFATLDENPDSRGMVIQLPAIEDLLEDEYMKAWTLGMKRHDVIYSFNIAAKTPVLVDETDIYSQYHIDIAFIPSQYEGIYIAMYSIRRIESDMINASAISVEYYARNREEMTTIHISEIREYGDSAVAGGNVFDDEMDCAGLFGIMHETFAQSSRTVT